jgi:hypothetical protein
MVQLFLGCQQFPDDLNQAVTQAKEKEHIQLISPVAVQGCYKLNLSAWAPSILSEEDVKYVTPPKRIQLLAEPSAGGLEKKAYIVRPAPGTPASIHRYAFWKPTGPNTIYIAWTTGYSGLTMNLTSQSDVLQGRALTFWDYTKKYQTAVVSARKFECEKPTFDGPSTPR